MPTQEESPSPTSTKKTPPKSPTEPNPPTTATARFLPYLEELQKKLIQVVIVFIVAAVIGGINYQHILAFIMQRFDLSGVNVVLTSPYQVFELAIQTGLNTGLVVIVPLIIYHLLTFLKPALEPHEYKLLVSLIPIAFLLFVIGFGFGVWVMNFVITIFTKATLEFSIGNIWDISLFFSQILITAVLLGIVFQFPIVLTVLMRFRLVKRAKLIEYRPYIYVGQIIFAAALPPTDIFSLILLTIPLFFLFETTLLFNRNY